MTYEYERHTLDMYGLENGIGEEWTPDVCVALWQYKNRRLFEATLHHFNTGERIWAKTVAAAICEELDIDKDELDIYSVAGMMVEQDRRDAKMSDEEREEEEERQKQLKELVIEALEEFDYDKFYAEKAAAEAEEAMLENLFKED